MDSLSDFAFPDPLSVGEQAIAVALLSVYFITMGIFSVFLIIRRKHRLLLPRSVDTLLLFAWYEWALCLFVTISFFTGKPAICLPLSITYLLNPLFSVHYNLCSPSLVIANAINQGKLDYLITHAGEAKSPANNNNNNPNGTNGNEGTGNIGNGRFGGKLGKKASASVSPEMAAVAVGSGAGTTQTVGWFLKIKKYLKFQYRVLFGLVSLALELAIFALLYVYAPINGCCLRMSLLASVIYITLVLLILGYFYYMQSKIKDPLYWRLEVQLGALFALPHIVPLFLYIFFPNIFPEWFDYRWTTFVGLFSVVIWNMVFPVMLTIPRYEHALMRMLNGKFFLRPSNSHEMDPNLPVLQLLHQGVDIFQVVMENPQLYEAFKQYCQDQWCVENIMFLKEVDRFMERAQETGKPNPAAARRIYAEYIAVDSPLQVNLDSELHHHITSVIREANLGQEVPSDIFLNARREVAKILKDDTFDRWRRDPSFKEALKKATSQSHGSQGDTGMMTSSTGTGTQSGGSGAALAPHSPRRSGSSSNYQPQGKSRVHSKNYKGANESVGEEQAS